MFNTFNSLARQSASAKTYVGRTAKSCKTKIDVMAADFQKFRDFLLVVKALKPTGVQDHQICSMAVDMHLGKRDGMTYQATDFPHWNCPCHLAIKVLKKHPKFAPDTAVVESRNIPEDGERDGDDIPDNSLEDVIILSLIHIWRCRRYSLCRSRWSPYH